MPRLLFLFAVMLLQGVGLHGQSTTAAPSQTQPDTAGEILPAGEEEASDLTQNLPREFPELAQLREELAERQLMLDREREKILPKLSRADADFLESFIADTERDLNRAQDPAQKESLRDTLERNQRDLKNLRDAQAELRVIERRIQTNRRLIFATDRRIADLLNVEARLAQFRFFTSIAFCVLVAVIISGFFFIASREKIAINLFSGERGIQFITLFLVVIAIVLFGILNTLEGKELSALLGALSGYILGRTSATATSDGRNSQSSGG